MHKHSVKLSNYVSEFDSFLGQYLEHHPEVLNDQRRGWYIFWDKDVDLAGQEQAQRDAVPLPPYYYP